jgi:DHA1 family inner membrane transport protein
LDAWFLAARRSRRLGGRYRCTVDIGRSDLAKLTLGKATVNTSLRWIPFFLPTLAFAFDSSTSTLALLLGIAEACGLTTVFVGRRLDAGHERLVMIVSLIGVVVASGLALVGSSWLLAAAVVVLGVSSAHITVAGHAWISARVPFERRAKFIGIFETSWAAALLVGVPFVALLISVFGWRGPFVAVAIVAIIAALLIGTIDDGVRVVRRDDLAQGKTPISFDAWLIIGASALLGMAGLTTIVVAGTWLDESLGVSTAGVGLVAIAFGIAELTASAGSSAFADRLGKLRTVQFSTTGALVGLGVIASAQTSLFIGTTGLLMFFVCFEYSIVTSFSLVSESMPEARGRALAVGNATGMLVRGTGVAAAGFLYDSFGIRGPVTVSMGAALLTLLLLTITSRRRPDLA